MSSSDGADFHRWVAGAFADGGGFTALIILLEIGGDKVTPLTCSHLHFIGPEVRWREMRDLLDRSGRKWQGAAFFTAQAPGGGPVADFVAQAQLQSRAEEVIMNRMRLNDAALFDRRGRLFRVDPAEGAT